MNVAEGLVRHCQVSGLYTVSVQRKIHTRQVPSIVPEPWLVVCNVCGQVSTLIGHLVLHLVFIDEYIARGGVND